MKNAIYPALLFFSLSAASFPAEKAMTEGEKIAALLDCVERSNVVFIRNGNEYPPKEARKHLQMKLSRAGGRVRTAEDFIKYIASRSYLSGRPYTVRFPDGRTMETGAWLRAMLTGLEKKCKPRIPAP